MPTVLRDGPYRFFFYSGDGGQPRHVHVESSGSEAKFWLDPIALARNQGYTQKELRKIEQIIVGNLNQLRGSWDDYFRP